MWARCEQHGRLVIGRAVALCVWREEVYTSFCYCCRSVLNAVSWTENGNSDQVRTHSDQVRQFNLVQKKGMTNFLVDLKYCFKFEVVVMFLQCISKPLIIFDSTWTTQKTFETALNLSLVFSDFERLFIGLWVLLSLWYSRCMSNLAYFMPQQPNAKHMWHCFKY